MNVKTKLVAAFALLALPSCANNEAIRSLAAKTAAAAQSYSTATADFAAAQASAAGQDRSRISTLKAYSLEPAGESSLFLRSWKLAGDKAKAEKFASATAVGPDAIVASLGPAPAAPQAAKRNGVDLKSPVKTLTQISQAPDLLSQATFLGAYGQAVNDEIEKIRKAAQAESDAASAPEATAPAAGG